MKVRLTATLVKDRQRSMQYVPEQDSQGPASPQGFIVAALGTTHYKPHFEYRSLEDGPVVRLRDTLT